MCTGQNMISSFNTECSVQKLNVHCPASRDLSYRQLFVIFWVGQYVPPKPEKLIFIPFFRPTCKRQISDQTCKRNTHINHMVETQPEFLRVIDSEICEVTIQQKPWRKLRNVSIVHRFVLKPHPFPDFSKKNVSLFQTKLAGK